MSDASLHAPVRSGKAAADHLRGDAAVVADLLASAGIAIGGPHPWDLRVTDDRAYRRILRYGNLGMGEAYMDGWVDCPRWDELATRVLRSPFADKARASWRTRMRALEGKLVNLGAKHRAFRVGEEHYDAGNDLFAAMLDPRMTYTCAYWHHGGDLAKAQEAKLDLVCRKTGLLPGMRVLDIGCGWGSFARFATERYRVEVVGITVSKEQAALARERCAGLPVEIRLEDYRDVTGTFDRVVSLGMFEHVFHKNYRTYMRVAHRVLTGDGMFLLHTIGGNESATSFDPFLTKYIFPNAMLPSIAQIGTAIEGLFVMEDWHNFGPDYDRTLMAWHDNVERAWWPSLASKYGEPFHRMWRYYLLTCAATFRARYNQLWQVVLSKRGVPGPYGYQTVR